MYGRNKSFTSWHVSSTIEKSRGASLISFDRRLQITQYAETNVCPSACLSVYLWAAIKPQHLNEFNYYSAVWKLISTAVGNWRTHPARALLTPCRQGNPRFENRVSPIRFSIPMIGADEKVEWRTMQSWLYELSNGTNYVTHLYAGYKP